jgi:hypothetical protein
MLTTEIVVPLDNRTDTSSRLAGRCCHLDLIMWVITRPGMMASD